MLDLKIGRCRFIVAGLADANPLEKSGHIRIGSKYPNVALDYFHSKGRDIEVIKIDGSVELAPVLGLTDGIVDIMETGATLKENGLVVYDTAAELSARVIVNKASFKMKRDEIMEFINDLERMVNHAEEN
jgi:ATP phosphoribosyltransferase